MNNTTTTIQGGISGPDKEEKKSEEENKPEETQPVERPSARDIRTNRREAEKMGRKKPVYELPAVDMGDLIEDKTVGPLTADALKVRASYGIQPLVRVIIPRSKEEPEGAVHPFCVNQFKFYVRKGGYVDVPESVADMILDAYQQSEAVLRDHELNMNNNSKAQIEFGRK